ncbi:MAG: hypothetical protein CO109_02960, partial [Deltaproteobacteria bacterium CG_4_9_14_3_um_filter_65_9]
RHPCGDFKTAPESLIVRERDLKVHVYKATKDLLLVARAMGHKDLSTTERYVRLDEFALREAGEKMF